MKTTLPLLLLTACAADVAPVGDTAGARRALTERITCQPDVTESVTFTTPVQGASYYELRSWMSDEYIAWYAAEGGQGFDYPYDQMQVVPMGGVLAEPNAQGLVEAFCTGRPNEYSLSWAWHELYVEGA